MKIKAQATSPDDIELTLTATMTLGNWKRIMAAMEKGAEHHWMPPFAEFIQSVRKAVDQADKEIVVRDD